jgi:hypothetical protein
MSASLIVASNAGANLAVALSGTGSAVAAATTSFTDVTDASGVAHSSETYGASWGDLNGDGYPDLFVSDHRTMKSLFVNQRNGTFVDIASTINNFENRPHADTHGASWADAYNNGQQELLVSVGTGNPSEWYVNNAGKLTFETLQDGFDVPNVGGRMPMWLDYDGDHRLDVLLSNFAGPAQLFHQNANGTFTDVSGAAGVHCVQFHYAQLIDVNGDGRLELLCPDEVNFPQKIYSTVTFPWTTLYDSTRPAAFFPLIQNVADSAVADFNNDGHMDVFILGGVQMRPSSVVQGGANRIEALLIGGSKGFTFVSTSTATFTIDWNKEPEGGTTNLTKIQIGSKGVHPSNATVTLDPAQPIVWGMPPKPTSVLDLPLLQIGYNQSTHLWTLAIVTTLTPGGTSIFSQGYIQVLTSAPISGLQPTGLWPTDKPAPPTLLMYRNGVYVDETVAAGLDTPVQCGSVTAGDFDNDMYVDLYLACRTGASNIADILYHNNGDGTFTAIPNAGGAQGPIGLAIADGAGTADSVVSADYDEDGFLDLFVTNGLNLQPKYVGGPNRLFHNNGNQNHWIELDLIGVNSDTDATGARVYATALGVTQFRVQDGRYHRWSQDSRRIHFGLASATSVSLTINWPSGLQQTFPSVAANKIYTITEGGTPLARVPLAP